SWIRQALLHVCPPPAVWADQFAALMDYQQCALLEQVREGWVKGQKTHFDERHKKHHIEAAQWKIVGLALWGLSVFFLAVLLVSGLFGKALGGLLSPWQPPSFLLVLSISLVIVGGLCMAYRERQAHEELAKQYERMRIVFSNGDRELETKL